MPPETRILLPFRAGRGNQFRRVCSGAVSRANAIRRKPGHAFDRWVYDPEMAVARAGSADRSSSCWPLPLQIGQIGDSWGVGAQVQIEFRLLVVSGGQIAALAHE